MLTKHLFPLLAAVALILAACGGSAVQQEPPPRPDVSMEEVAVEAPAAEFDLVASVDEMMSSIPAGFHGMKLDALKSVMETDAVLIDVREVAEYEAGHIPGAINVPLRTLAQNLELVPTDMPVVVYCKSGHRAAMAVSTLQILGYENSRAFGGSYKAWTEAGEPVSTDMVKGKSFTTPDIEPDLLAAVDGFLTNVPEGFLAMGDIEKFNDAMDNGAFVVDVREVAEYDEGHIPGAVNIPIRTLAQNLDQIPANQPVFVYCKSGYRAAMSMAALQTLGYSNVKSFPPGITGWNAAGQPVAMQ